MNETLSADDVPVVIVGAGPAGLATSYWLKRLGVAHVVLERDRVAEAWRSRRWDSFVMNTANWMNRLPDEEPEEQDASGFARRDEFVGSLERYAQRYELPVREFAAVAGIDRNRSGDFALRMHAPGATLTARCVVVATGIHHRPRRPTFWRHTPATLTQLHASEYRRAEDLPKGGVVVVGSGQSGGQIAEDLNASARTVYLCTSRAGRTPRRYRGRDIGVWFEALGLNDVTPRERGAPTAGVDAQPLLSGGRWTLSLQGLARRGVTLLGRLEGFAEDSLLLDGDPDSAVASGDAGSRRTKALIDERLRERGLELPPLEDDLDDEPAPEGLPGVFRGRRFDLAAAGVTCLVWATGYESDFSWIQADVVDASGQPRHEAGTSPVPGLYFVGLPWLRNRRSGLIHGIRDDTEVVAQAIAARLKRSTDMATHR